MKMLDEKTCKTYVVIGFGEHVRQILSVMSFVNQSNA